MTKIYVKREIGTLDVDFVDSTHVITELQHYIEKYEPSKITLEMNYVPYSDDNEKYVAIYVNELETDKEESIREEQDAAHKMASDNQAKMQYEELKKRFG